MEMQEYALRPLRVKCMGPMGLNITVKSLSDVGPMGCGNIHMLPSVVVILLWQNLEIYSRPTWLEVAYLKDHQFNILCLMSDATETSYK